MPLVDYSDSESSEHEDRTQGVEHSIEQRLGETRDGSSSLPVKIPPLPSGFHNLYASQVRSSTQDDPSLHDGRTRQTPHIEGSWNIHIYIEWIPKTTDVDRLESGLSQFNATQETQHESNHIHSFVRNDVGVVLPLHISLSSPISLVTDQLDPFLSHLKSRIVATLVQPFAVRTTSLDWVSNKDKSRWFLVLRLDPKPKDSINKLLQAVNETSRSFNKPTLYDTPSETVTASTPDLSQHCHISIAWSLKAPRIRGEGLENIKLGGFEVSVAEIKAKMGNKVYSIPLAGE